MPPLDMPLILEGHEGLHLIAGVDEAGRGPLAGDVVAAAVILPRDCTISGLADSKKLSPKQRDTLYPLIRQQAVAFAVARASVDEIDRLNILHASMLAMKRAVTALVMLPEFVYVDGNRCPDWQYPSQAVVKGDSKIASIAAASILAKVERDQEMRELDSRFPGYGLAQHKGYPTKAHLAALQRLGPCEIHRKSFSPVMELLN